MEEKDKSNFDKIEVGNIVSFGYNNNTAFLKGQAIDVTDTHVTIENYQAGKVKVLNNKDLMKFYPGQKFDLRELDVPDPNNHGMTVKQNLNKLLKNTSIKNFDQLFKQYPKEVGKLLRGDVTMLIEGTSLMKVNKEDEVKQLKSFGVKFAISKGRDSNLKLNPLFRMDTPTTTIKNKKLSEEEAEALLFDGKTVILDRPIGYDKERKFRAYFDTDLNRVVALPVSKTVAERIIKSQSKKEEITSKTKQAPVKKVTTKAKQAAAKSATTKRATTKKPTGKKL